MLADVAADVFELVGRDLALLATKVRAGALLYDRVETGLPPAGGCGDRRRRPALPAGRSGARRRPRPTGAPGSPRSRPRWPTSWPGTRGGWRRPGPGRRRSAAGPSWPPPLAWSDRCPSRCAAPPAELRAHGELLRTARAAVDRLRRAYDDLRAERTAGPHGACVGRPGPVAVRRLRAEAGGGAAARACGAAPPAPGGARPGGGARARDGAAVGVAAHGWGGTGRGGGAVGTPVGAAGRTELAAQLPMLAAARAAAVRAPCRARGHAHRGRCGVVAALTTDEQRPAPSRAGRPWGPPTGCRCRPRGANERAPGRDIARPAGSDRRRAGRHGCSAPAWWAAAALGAPGQRDPGTGRRCRALLVFRPAAFGCQGRAAIAVGDVTVPTTSRSWCPGSGRRSATLASLTRTALRVDRGATSRPDRDHGHRRVAGLRLAGASRVALDDAAEDGAELLADDLLAVRAARRLAPHLTVVGALATAARTAGLALREHPDRDRRRGAASAALARTSSHARRPRRPGRPRLRRAPAAATRSATWTGSAPTRRTSRSVRPGSRPRTSARTWRC